MILHLHGNQLTGHTERNKDTGLSSDFRGEMAKVVVALKAAGFEPYAFVANAAFIAFGLWLAHVISGIF